jgi:hypothetical protein
MVLATLDSVAIASIARCFYGPGELWLLIPVCLVAHLFAGGGRRLGRRIGKRRLTVAGFLLAAAATFLIPLSILDGSSFSVVLPLHGTWHLVGQQFATSWGIFSNQVAPVAEAHGLLLAASWAAGAVAMAAEVLYADGSLPAVLALVPAFDVVVFTGTLGTSTGRSVELVVLVWLAIGFLTAAARDQPARSSIVMRRVGTGEDRQQRGNAGRAQVGQPPIRPPSAGRTTLPGVTIAAVVAAGLLGPVLPGATSSPLIAWHGGNSGRPGHGSGGGGGGSHNRSIVVSSLVQVAEQEVKNPTGRLFTVSSRRRLREQLMTLDEFDGERWAPVPGRRSGAVPRFRDGLSRLERRPPAAEGTVNSAQIVTQVIHINSLGGNYLPTPGAVVGIDGTSGTVQLDENEPSGPVQAAGQLSSGLTYGIRAALPPASASVLRGSFGFRSSSLAVDLRLPHPIPPSLVNLAHGIVGNAISPYDEAVKIQDYFLIGNGFRYHLPSVSPTGAIANTSQTYRALGAFLSKRVGYCQQFATAFAVLARIEGLPTRIAVGFLPGRQIAKHQYVVTGADVHAWPEVYLSPYGWVSFEPTPGSQRVPASPPKASVTTLPSTPTTVGRGLPAHNLKGPPPGNDIHPGAVGRHKGGATPTGSARRRETSGAGYVLLSLVVLAGLWCLVVPVARQLQRRRARRDSRRAAVVAWQTALRSLSAAGAHRRLSETRLEFAARVRDTGILSSQGAEALDSLARRADLAIYSPSFSDTATTGGRGVVFADGAATSRSITAPSPDSRAAFSEAAVVRRSAKRRTPRLQRLVMVVDPRDLVGTG